MDKDEKYKLLIASFASNSISYRIASSKNIEIVCFLFKENVLETKVDSVLQLMTLEEKSQTLNQLCGFWDMQLKEGQAAKKKGT
jgi:beta-glucosidase